MVAPVSSGKLTELNNKKTINPNLKVEKNNVLKNIIKWSIQAYVSWLVGC